MNNNILTRIDPELARRANTIICKLKLLGEAKSSGKISAEGLQQKAESSPPPEVRLDSDAAQPPPKDRSLYEWYIWHFARATSEYRFRLLCYLAERDYERYRRRPSDAKRGPITLRGKDGGEAETEGMKRIVEWYSGIEAVEVAILEECSIDHVRKARRVFRRVESDGRALTGWKGWDDDERLAQVKRLRVGGYSQQEVAAELGVSDRTVRKYWAWKAPTQPEALL